MYTNDEVVVTGMGAVAGTVVGSATAIGTVSAAGSVAGLSAAGMTSGLAAIGASVGGGMAAGIVITAAAPVAVAALGGFAAYCAYRNFIRG